MDSGRLRHQRHGEGSAQRLRPPWRPAPCTHSKVPPAGAAGRTPIVRRADDRHADSTTCQSDVSSASASTGAYSRQLGTDGRSSSAHNRSSSSANLKAPSASFSSASTRRAALRRSAASRRRSATNSTPPVTSAPTMTPTSPKIASATVADYFGAAWPRPPGSDAPSPTASHFRVVVRVGRGSVELPSVRGDAAIAELCLTKLAGRVTLLR